MHGKKNVLVTGGLGNLGSWISRYLAQKGYKIFILSQSAKYELEGIEYTLIEADITDSHSLKKLEVITIDYCVHLASFNEFFLPDYPQKALQINTLGTRNLLEVLSKKSIKHFIYFSTFHVYGVNEGIINEESPLMPKNDYASTHLFAEYYCSQFKSTHDLNYTILRLTNSYGCPMDNNSNKWYLALNDLTQSAYKHKEILLQSNGEVQRDFIYMEDVASVVEKLLQKAPTNTIYNLSAKKSYKILELAKMVQSVYQQRYNVLLSIKINSKDTTLYEDLVVDNNKLKQLVGYNSTIMFTQEINKIFNLLDMKHER